MTVPNWDFTGSTMVTPAFIRLTPDQQSRVGGLWNKIVSDLVILIRPYVDFLSFLDSQSIFLAGKLCLNLKFLVMDEICSATEWLFGT